jgi:hypothetical protein
LTTNTGRGFLDARYLHQVLDGIESVLREAAGVEVAYLERLTSFAATLDKVPAPPPTDASDVFRRAERKARASIQRFLTAARAIRRMLSQARQIGRWPPPSNALIALVSSTRLYVGAGAIDPKQNLALLAKHMGSGLGTHAERVLAADTVLLFDVLPISRQWADYERCSRDRIVIVDGVFALFFFVRSLATDGRRKFPLLFTLLGEAMAVARDRKRPVWNFFRTLFYGAITSAYGDLINLTGARDALFFTCNSRLGEVLRAYLVQRPEVTRIIELMHGIGSKQSEELAAGILTAGQRYGDPSKHYYVPQVPNLPLEGVFERQRWSNTAAVNAFLNQYLLESVLSGRPLRELVAAEYDAITAHAHGPAPILITLFGNYPYDGKLFDSPTFCAEHLLIELITGMQSESRRAFSLTYVPHPMHVAITAHPVFHQPAVRVGSSSVLGWLLSDLGASLVSSTIFEAAHFGVRCFTPVLSSDGFFSPAYMSAVAHPRSASLEDFMASLRGWAAESTPLPRDAVIERALRRLGTMGWDQQFEAALRGSGERLSLAATFTEWRSAIA